MANPRYDDREAMAPPPDHRWTLLLEQIPPGARVLELGCGRGYAAVAMASRGCTVVGVELDGEAAAEARSRCERVFTGDVAAVLASDELAGRTFDVIVAADVIEHLVDPTEVLRRCRGLLGDGGFILASIPNATHASVVLEMCEGRLPLSDEGLLDRTHLHFFGEDSALDLFARAGYRPAVVARRRLDPRNTELRSRLGHVPDEVLAFLDRNPNADTYQFIIRADPTSALSISRPTPDRAPEAPLRNGLVREATELREELRRYHEAAVAREREIARLTDRADTPPYRPRLPRGGSLRALFVTADGDAPGRYRCVHGAAQLVASGGEAKVSDWEDPLLREDVDHATVLVLFRLPWSDRVGRLVARARARGIPIVFDTDDLIFDPAAIECLTFLDRLPPEDRDEYLDLLPRVHRTFAESDSVVAATASLARHARSLGKVAVTHPNLASPPDVRRGFLLRALRKAWPDRPWIGYASGSHTHDEDLACVAPALATVFERRDDVRLMIIGFVNLPASLHRFADRVTRLPYLDHEVYSWALSRCRVVISPTAVVNAFADAKSPMKLIEAGLLDVPTVASPSDAYRRILTNGWNGWLASSEEDWVASLLEGLDAERAAAVGRNARGTVLRELTFSAHGGRLYELLAQLGAVRPDAGTRRTWPAPRARTEPRWGSTRAIARRWRQRWSLLRRGDVGKDSLSPVAEDWWRGQPVAFLDPSAFESFLASNRSLRVEGWLPAGDARASRPGAHRSIGNDPQLLRTGIDIDARSRRFLVVRQKTLADDRSPSAQLFFATPDANFSEAASVRFPIAADGALRTYVLDLASGAWPSDGTIIALRYDPLDCPGSFEVAELALLPEAPELLAPASSALRTLLAKRYLRGRGAEFGALQNPLSAPAKTRVFYVDELSYAAARRRYPELEGQALVRPSVLSNVEQLALRSHSLDFAIANHLLEHARDPIRALRELVRVVRPGGVVFAAVPDVGNPLDRGRPVTPPDHLVADHDQRDQRARTDLDHYREAITSAHPEMGPAELEALIRERTAIAESIHFHTFDEASFRWLLGRVSEEAEVEYFARNRVGDWDEYVAVLRRRRQLEQARS
jgi:2-polyprenyl-3-methyl-5-hydroxy-6-metoxy-1,4-benzoquinol methylase/glycosyltransferase involved in cell wall biosynthesis